MIGKVEVTFILISALGNLPSIPSLKEEGEWMPVTRGKARLMESQEEDELSQQTRDEQEQEQEQPANSGPVDLKEMAEQLKQTLKHLLTTHRFECSQLESDAATIQAGMDELYHMQEDRAQHIVSRLKNASSTILTFGEASHGERPETEGNIADEVVD